MDFVIHALVNAAGLYLAARIVKGIQVKSAGVAIVGALVLGAVNWLFWPFFLPLFVVPLALYALGVVAFLTNALALKVAAFLVRGFEVADYGAAMKATAVLWVGNGIVRLLIR